MNWMIGTGFLFHNSLGQKNTFIPSGNNTIMYDLSYVKKRRRKKIASLVSLFTAVGITSLIIISFLGRTVGTFSVKLKNSDVSLTLSKNLSFDEKTSYLYVDDVGRLRETTYSNLPDDDFLDNEENPTKNPKAMLGDGSYSFIKYTFYISNTGDTIARYNLSINITDSQESQDGNHRLLDDTLRIMVYENDPYDVGAENPHKKRVFANDTDYWNYFIDESGEKRKTKQEFISLVPEDRIEDVDKGYILAETFVSSSVAARYEVGNFQKDNVMRYTIVVWLEGEDPESKNSEQPPLDASLKLGVSIAAYENV